MIVIYFEGMILGIIASLIDNFGEVVRFELYREGTYK